MKSDLQVKVYFKQNTKRLLASDSSVNANKFCFIHSLEFLLSISSSMNMNTVVC